MPHRLFSSDLWQPALEKYAETTGLTVKLFAADAEMVLATVHPTPLIDLFQEYGFEPGLFAECARRCLLQTTTRPAIAVAELHGMAVVGTSLVLEGAIVGAAVAGYALTHFSQVPSVQRWARTTGVPFEKLWSIVRRHPPTPERRLMLHGELLQVLGDALLRENHRTRQYEDTAAELRAASAAKDEFLAVVSHELRTPLSPILGWAQVLQRTGSGEVRNAGEIIERNVLRQTRIIEDLLDVNRIVHGTVKLDRAPHELSGLIREATEPALREAEEKGVRLDVVEENGLFVDGDAGRLHQVFKNILSNAVKFTPKDGSIRVTMVRDKDSARVTVADTGIGIAPDFLPHAFEIFHQQEQGTRREHEGLGIGLALVEKLTELHGGTVTIASPGVGRGTDVTITLPLLMKTHEAQDVALGEDRSAPQTPLAGVSILVVEDSDDTLYVLRVLLEHLGAKVSVAHDGREALRMAQDVGPDLVLCDLRMPKMDGFEFIREMRRGPASVQPPVVAMSGLVSAADRQRTREAGFEAHISKPFDTEAVVAALRSALHTHPHAGTPGVTGPV